MSEPTSELLAERQTTHGEFRENSKTSQRIKAALHDGDQWGRLKDFQRESLEMIAHKIGRLLAGDSQHQDHWDDIAGYARLAADRTREDSTKNILPHVYHASNFGNICKVCNQNTAHSSHIPV